MSEFSPRQRGDREHQKFGLHGTSYPSSTPITLNLGAKTKETDGTDPTAVSEDVATLLKAERIGRLFVSNVHPRFFNLTTSYLAPQAKTTLKAPPGASLSYYLTDIVMSVGDAAGTIRLFSGVNGNTHLNDVISTMYVSANKQLSLQLSQPIKLAANSTLSIRSIGMRAHTLLINGYVAP